MRTTLHARGPLPADEVWERYAVPARWPRWAPYILGVECADHRIGVGSAGYVRGPLGVRVAFVVTAFDDDARTWSWDVALGPVVLSLDHGVRASGEGTRTWLTVAGPAPVVLPYLVPARVSLALLLL